MKEKQKLHLIGDFKWKRWASFAPLLSQWYDVETHDVNWLDGKVDPTNMNSITYYAPVDYDALYFIIQNKYFCVNDQKLNVVYLHFDYVPCVRKASLVITPKYNAENCATRDATHYTAHGNDNWASVEPFFDCAPFDPDPVKTALLSDISDTIPFEDYKYRMERSKYLIIKSTAIRKRTFEALFCKTIPIICCPEITRKTYEQLGFEDKKNCYFLNFDQNGYWTGDQSIPLLENGNLDGNRVFVNKFAIENRIQEFRKLLESC